MNQFSDTFTSLDYDTKKRIESDFKIIKVDLFSPQKIKCEIFGDPYFNDNKKLESLENMINYYATHKYEYIYTKKTDLLCNKKERFCICNTNAEIFRKNDDGKNYKEGDQFISWFKKSKEPF